jgi:PAS domain S-box-containing protein
MHPTGQTHFSFLAGRPALVLAVIVGFLLHAALPLSMQERVRPFVAGGLPVVLVMLLLVEFGTAWQRRRRRRIQSELMEELRTANSRLGLRVIELSRRREDLELLESAVVHAHDAVVVLDPDPHPGAGRQVRYVNDAFCRMSGYAREEIVGRSLHVLRGPLSDSEILAEIREALDAGKPLQTEIVNHRKDGTPYWTELSLVPVPGEEGSIAHWVMIQRDVTDRHKLKQQLLEAQKLEAVGMLAGGIAHDFNNLLTGILGNLSLVHLPGNDPNQPRLAAVEQAAERAAELTMKLLSLARRNQLVTGPVAPEVALAEVADALRMTGHSRLEVKVEVAPGCRPVLADAGLLNRALLALGRNAVEAMPSGGMLTLSAEPVRAPASASGRAAKSGSFVRLSIADTGVGMTGEVRTKLFEPFFSTKGTAKSIGLGLGMVRGIVNQHQGWLECTSTPGEGTRIDLYFPPFAERPAAEPQRPQAETETSVDTPAPADSGEAARTILLVDDEPMIREVGRTVLEREGYCVVTASDGVEAVDLFERDWERIGLVILDVTMPRMSGPEAYHHLTRIHADARILFSTGYSADNIAELDGAFGLLNKPYRPVELVQAVREALTATPVGP